MLHNNKLREDNSKLKGKSYQQNIDNSLRSESMNEILSRKSDFFEKWALVLVLLVLLLLIAGTWLIKYPDIIMANAMLSAENAPKEVIVRQEGKLVRLFIKNDDSVTKFQIIAWIESTADHQQVLFLSYCLDSILNLLKNNHSDKVVGALKPEFGKLGDLQSSYQSFMGSWRSFSDYLTNGYYFKKKNELYADQFFLRKMHKSLEQQRELTNQDLQLANETLTASDSLYKNKVISHQDMRELKSKFLSKQLLIPQLESQLLSNELEQASKQKEINELEHTISQQKTIFQQTLLTLQNLTEDWKKKYIIFAPVSGKISFVIPVQENQYLSAGKVIGFVNPSTSKYFAWVTLHQDNFGKVAPGQKIQLRFDAYPFQEFGYVYGRLSYISKVPTDSGFLANISLPNGLRTSYNTEIQFRNGLACKAIIITKDSRLLDRFYYDIVKMMHR